MELLLEILFEFLLQLVGDVVVDAGSRKLGPTGRVIRTTVLFALLGVGASFLSLVVYPRHVIQDPALRLAALAVLPALNGWLMSRWGRSVEARGEARIAFEYFLPAFVFALAFGGLRFLAAF